MAQVQDQTDTGPDQRQKSSLLHFWAAAGSVAFVSYHRGALKELLLGVVGLGLCGLAALRVLALVIIRRNNWHAADPPIEEVGLFDDRVPEPVQASLRETVPRIEALGFNNLGHYLGTNSVPNVVNFVALFEHRPARQIAEFAHIITQPAGLQKITTVLFLTTEFTDGTSLVTNNSENPTLAPSVRRREGTGGFPDVRDPARLHAIHNACVARFAGDAIRVEHQTNRPIEFLRDKMRKDTARMAETGYYYLDEEAGLYRLTWKGAMMAVIKLTWPVKPVRAFLRRRRAARLLRELGLESEDK